GDEVIGRLYPGRGPAAREFGITAAMVLPLRARATITGVIAFAFIDAGRTRDPDLVYAVNGFAARAAIALDNARRFDDERSTVRTLTDALLPAGLPRPAGYDLAAGTGRWASAGHPPAILVRGATPKVLDAPHGPALGVSAHPEYRDRAVVLGPGDLFVLYTDGVVERRGQPFDAGLGRLASI